MPNIQTFALPSPYEQQMLEAKRRQQMAELLQQQAGRDITPQQGRVASKINPLAGVAQMLTAGLAGYNRRQADEAQLAANRAAQEEIPDFLNKLNQGSVTPDNALAAALAQGGSNPATAPTRQDMIQRLATGSASSNPYIKQLSGAMLPAYMKPEAQQEYYDAVPVTLPDGGVKMVQYSKTGGAPRETVGQKYEKPTAATVHPITIRRDGRDVVVDALTGKELGEAPPKQPAVNVSLGVNTAKTYGTTVAENLAKSDSALIDAARAAPQQIEGANRIRSLLAQNPITGTGANQRLALDKALATAGIIDPNRTRATESLVSELASGTLDSIRSSGLGAGQGFTDNDRKFLEKAKSGNIEINAQTLADMARIRENVARKAIEKGNSVIERLRRSPNFSPDLGLEPVAMPAASSSLPAGFVILGQGQ